MGWVLIAAILLVPVRVMASAQAPRGDVTRAVQALATETGTAARMAAAAELGRSRDARAFEPLARALRDPNINVRWAAIEALGDLGDPRAVRLLVAYLDRKEAYRWGHRLVANALGAIGGGEAVAALTGLLTDPDPFARRAAALGLLRQDDSSLLARVAEVLREEPDDHLATVKREFARLRDGEGRRRTVARTAAAGTAAGPVRPHEWAGLRIGASTLADATVLFGAPLQRTADSLLFRGEGAPSPVRAESIVVNASSDGVVNSIFVFPVWGTLDHDVRAVLGRGRVLTYGEFLRVTSRTAVGAGTSADGKLHYLPPDLLTELHQEMGILVVYDSADVASRDRLVKLLIVY